MICAIFLIELHCPCPINKFCGIVAELRTSTALAQKSLNLVHLLYTMYIYCMINYPGNINRGNKHSLHSACINNNKASEICSIKNGGNNQQKRGGWKMSAEDKSGSPSSLNK
jgi:hypothetical protein